MQIEALALHELHVNNFPIRGMRAYLGCPLFNHIHRVMSYCWRSNNETCQTLIAGSVSAFRTEWDNGTLFCTEHLRRLIFHFIERRSSFFCFVNVHSKVNFHGCVCSHSKPALKMYSSFQWTTSAPFSHRIIRSRVGRELD